MTDIDYFHIGLLLVIPYGVTLGFYFLEKALEFLQAHHRTCNLGLGNILPNDHRVVANGFNPKQLIRSVHSFELFDCLPALELILTEGIVDGNVASRF